MTKTLIQYTLLFVIMVLAQVLIFNRLYLFETAIPLAFIYFIIKLPITMGVIGVMSLSFFTGFTIDLFSDTPGMNALACTILATMRLPIFRLYVPREEDLTDPEPSIHSLGPGVFMKYALSITFVYCILYFVIESFTLFNLVNLILRIVGSTLLTFIIIMCIDNVVYRLKK